MSFFACSDDRLAQEVADFVGRITPCRERWEYCLDRASFRFTSVYLGETVGLNQRALPVCDRIVGIHRGGAAIRLRQMLSLGYEGAEEWARSRKAFADRPFFRVGPMEPWLVGHVYFARLAKYPHIVKVGFSRRVRARLDEIESKCGHLVEVRPGEFRVGTMADEHWWHHNWRATRISGEWFFDPFTTDRTLPAFLSRKPVLEAA